MLRKSLLTLTLALLLAGGFCFGIARLFFLRYEAGDIYPPYSTLRTDPLGTQAIFEALQELPEMEVRRNFRPLKNLKPERAVTLVYAGVAHESYWTERELQEFESLILNGSRAVFAFHPHEEKPVAAAASRNEDTAKTRKRDQVETENQKEDAAEEKNLPARGKKGKSDDRDHTGLISFRDVAKRFGFQFAFLPAQAGEAHQRKATIADPASPLEPEISWHSALHFSDLSSDWKPLYLSDAKPVVLERSYGAGSILLAGDSFFLSNQAMRYERSPKLVSRVFAGPALIVFDEEHLGVAEHPGIVQLAVKYRLQGVMIGLAVVALLFVWKNAVRFLPPLPEDRLAGDIVLGQDSAQGFSNLLRRSIKPADLLESCVKEWRRGSAHPAPVAARVEEIRSREEARPPKQRDSVATYRAISQSLATKTSPPPRS